MEDMSQLSKFQKSCEAREEVDGRNLERASQVYEAKGPRFYDSVLGSGIIFDTIVFLELE